MDFLSEILWTGNMYTNIPPPFAKDSYSVVYTKNEVGQITKPDSTPKNLSFIPLESETLY